MKEKLLNFKETIKKYNNILVNNIYNFINKYNIWIYFIIITILAVVARIVVFNKISGDVNGFIFNWYENLYNEGFSALGKQNGDYTPAYNYYLFFLSLFRIEPKSNTLLYFIKIYSVLFDFGVAIIASLIIYKLTDGNKIKTVLAYALTIMGLTVILNSAWWGQCDSIYAFFLLCAIYFFMMKKQRTAMIFIGLSFCFKLQTIFILPVFIIAMLRKEYKFRYLIWIPIIYIIMCIPACFAANSFFDRLKECLLVYVNQTGNSYKQLSLNAGTLYTIIFTNFKEELGLSSMAIPFAVAVIGTFIFIHFRTKKELNNLLYFKLFALYSLLVPFMLPHMHDRYYYISDVLIPLYALINVKKFYVAILSVTNSLIGYMVFLWNIPFFGVVPQDGSITDGTKAMSFRFGGILCLIAIIIITIDLYKELKDGNDEKEIENEIKKEEIEDKDNVEVIIDEKVEDNVITENIMNSNI